MVTVKNYKLENFIFVFNNGAPNIVMPREEEPVSFNIINGDYIETYKSTNSEKQTRRLALDKISHMQVSKKMKIIEPDILYDYNFFKNNICSSFGVDESKIKLKKIELINREKNISTYSITADIYPELYSILNKSFSLENLYYAFVGADEEEKKIIVDYLNSLKFIRVNSINYYNAKKIANKKELKLLNLDKTYEERLESTLIEATRNAHIIGLFNIDNPLLEIPTPIGNIYTDKEQQKRKEKEKNSTYWIKNVCGKE